MVSSISIIAIKDMLRGYIFTNILTVHRHVGPKIRSLCPDGTLSLYSDCLKDRPICLKDRPIGLIDRSLQRIAAEGPHHLSKRDSCSLPLLKHSTTPLCLVCQASNSSQGGGVGGGVLKAIYQGATPMVS